MYEQHFELERAPFSLLPDPEFLYLGKQHSSAKAFLESSAIVHDSFVVITGAIGAGKTTLVEGYLAELSANETVIVRINQTQISPTGFLRLLLDELGLKAFKARKPELLSKFRKFMARTAREGRNVVLVIDEAQNLSREVLEEIRMLTGGEHAAFLCVVLVGQPEFLETLESPGLMQLAQRCRLRSHIEALPEAESAAYIEHRIAVAGGDPNTLFSKSAKEAVFATTGGIPRLINSLCDTALICAYADGLKRVDDKEISAALRELNWRTPTVTGKPRSAPARRRRGAGKRSAHAAPEDDGQASARVAELQAELARMQSAEEELSAARQEIASLRNELSDPANQTEELARSHARLDELQGQIDDLSGASGSTDEMQALEADISRLTEEYSDVLARVLDSEAMLGKLELQSVEALEQAQQLAAQQDKVAALESANTRQAELIEELRAEVSEASGNATVVTDVKQALARQSESLEQSVQELEQLRAELADREVEREKLRDALESADEERQQLSASLAEHNASLVGRDNSIQTLKDEVRSKSRLIDELHDRLASLMEASDGLIDLASENQRLAEQLHSEKDTASEYAARIAELEQARTDQARAFADLEQASEQLHADLSENRDEYGKLAKQYDAEKELNAGNVARIAELETAHSQQSQAIADLEQSSGQLRADLSDSQKENKKLAGEHAAEKDQNALKTTRIEELERARTEQSQIVADLEQASEQLRTDLANSTKENDQLSEQLRLMREQDAANATRIADLEQAEIAKREVIAGLETDLERMHDDAAVNLQELQGLRADLNAAEQAKSLLVDTVKDLGEKLTGRDNTISTQEAELRRKNLLIDELHDKLAPLPALQSEALKLGNENAELSSELESRNERIVELQEAVSLGQQHLDDARREIDEAHSGQVNLHVQISELKTELATLQDVTKSRDELVTSLEAECRNRKKDLRKLRKELDESMDQSRELSDSLELGEERIKGLDKELSAAMETIREMGEASAQINADKETYQREAHEQKEQLTSLTQELTERSAELQALETDIRHKTETIKVLQLDVEATSEARKTDAASNSEYEALVAQLRGEVEARDIRIRELTDAQDETDVSVKTLRAQVEEQSALMQQLKKELAVSKEVADELRAELGDPDREYNETAVLTEENLEPEEETATHTTLEAGLIVTANGSPARRVALRDKRLIIGRTGDSDIKIDNEFASRHHAQIVFRNGRYILEDLNSTNGIFVNSRRVKKRQLRNRDVIRIGKDKLIFVLDQHTSH